jgi:hypothetical protein
VSAGHAVWRLKNARRLGRDRGVHTHASRGGGGAEHLFLRWDDHWKHGLARESRLKGLGNSDTPPIAMRARVRAMRETTQRASHCSNLVSRYLEASQFAREDTVNGEGFNRSRQLRGRRRREREGRANDADEASRW